MSEVYISSSSCFLLTVTPKPLKRLAVYVVSVKMHTCRSLTIPVIVAQTMPSFLCTRTLWLPSICKASEKSESRFRMRKVSIANQKALMALSSIHIGCLPCSLDQSSENELSTSGAQVFSRSADINAAPQP